MGCSSSKIKVVGSTRKIIEYDIEESLIECIYEIKDYNEIQIINNRNGVDVNEEIESKIKIWNNNQKEKLIFKKKFEKLGSNIITFKIEENLSKLSYIFKG